MGIPDLSAFLPFKLAHAAAHLPSSSSASADAADARLILGQPLQVFVESRTNARLVSVSADPAKVRAHVSVGSGIDAALLGDEDAEVLVRLEVHRARPCAERALGAAEPTAVDQAVVAVGADAVATPVLRDLLALGKVAVGHGEDLRARLFGEGRGGGCGGGGAIEQRVEG